MGWGGSAWAAILMGTGPTTGYSPMSGTGVSGRHSVSPSLPTPRLSPVPLPGHGHYSPNVSVPFTWICLRRHSMPSSRGTVRRLWIRQRGEFGGRDSRGTPFPRPHPPNSTEGEAGSGYRPHCPVVAEENVVPRNDNPSSGVSENPPRSQGRDIPADTGGPAPKAVRPPPDCLALVREARAQAGLSVRLRPLLPAAGGILPERRTFPSCRIFQLVRISEWILVRHL